MLDEVGRVSSCNFICAGISGTWKDLMRRLEMSESIGRDNYYGIRASHVALGAGAESTSIPTSERR